MRKPIMYERPAPALRPDVLSVSGLERDVLFGGPECLDRSRDSLGARDAAVGLAEVPEF